MDTINELAAKVIENALGPDDIVLVTGGTGFTGRYLLKALAQTGATIRVIARASSDRGELDRLDLEWFIGDVFDQTTIEKAMPGVTYVFHVAAAYREAKIDDSVYWKVHVQSTQLLANAALKQEGFKRFLHVSTVGVHGHIENPPADEHTRFAPGDEYQNTKVEAEKWVHEFASENNMPLTVVRPAAIYGPGDRRLLKIFKIAKLPVCPVLGYGSKGLYHLIHVDDLVNFMILAATHSNTEGEVYICGNEEAMSISDMIKLISQQLGRKPLFIRLPATPFFWLGDLCELVCKPLNIEPPIYRRRVAFFTKDRSFNTTKMRNDTGYQYQHSNESGLRALTDWYVEQGWL